MTMDPVDAYQTAAGFFGETISLLGDHQWELATFPSGWMIVTSAAEVVVGDAQIPDAVAGSRWSPVSEFDVGVLGTNPVATWRGTALAAIAALRSEGAIDVTFPLDDGVARVADLAGVRATDNLVRAWDIGTAAGLDPVLPAEVVDWLLDFWVDHQALLLQGEILGANPVDPPTDATPAQRLLALAGRASQTH